MSRLVISKLSWPVSLSHLPPVRLRIRNVPQVAPTLVAAHDLKLEPRADGDVVDANPLPRKGSLYRCFLITATRSFTYTYLITEQPGPADGHPLPPIVQLDLALQDADGQGCPG